MKSDRASRRPVRYAIFIGVLAGSVLSGSGAFAVDPLSQENFYSEIIAKPNGTFELAGDIDIKTVVHTDIGDGEIVDSAPVGTTVFGTFTGSINGKGMKISGLETPLFNAISGGSASVTNLILEASASGVSGKGILSNFAVYGAQISNIDATGNVEGGALSGVGGLLGEVDADVDVLDSSFTGNVHSSGSFIGGLLGVTNGGDIINSSSSGTVEGTDYVGGLVGWQNSGVTSGSFTEGHVIGISGVGGLAGFAAGDILNSFSDADVSSTDGSYIGGLVGQGTVNISSSFATGNVLTVRGQLVGGLIGLQGAVDISNSYATGKVEGGSWVGGLVGKGNGTQITNAYASGDIKASGDLAGGLIGASFGTNISNVIATGNVTGSGSSSQLGGIAGYAEFSTIQDVSYSGEIDGLQNLGGIVGNAGYNTQIRRAKVIANITGDSYQGGVAGTVETGFYLSNTEVDVNLEGVEAIGGLVGYARGASAASDIEIENSYWKGSLMSSLGANYTGSAIAYAQRTDDSTAPWYYTTYTVADPLYPWFAAKIDGNNVVGRVNSPEWMGTVVIPSTTSVLQNFSKERQIGNTWAICASTNGTNPYLIALYPSDPCKSRQPKGLILEKKIKEIIESKKIEIIEKTLGFMKETSLTKSAPIAFLEPAEKFEISRVRAVEIAPTANVKVSAKAGEALQISLKSESKDPVELWVKSPDGSWLLAGVITFDKDGKAILPPLQFKSVGDYSLVLSKPSADSAKGSAPLNQTGSLLVAVS